MLGYRIDKIRVCEMHILRGMFGLTLRDHILDECLV